TLFERQTLQAQKDAPDREVDRHKLLNQNLDPIHKPKQLLPRLRLEAKVSIDCNTFVTFSKIELHSGPH
ncbi:MAG: hypothetical protein P1V19_25970, partial [Gimesia sp.]|nr:hypothetical protein [Gimesia sp.]